MADEQWQKVREVFDAALQQRPEERQSYIKRVCGNNKALFTEVESLLSSLDNSDGFLETPALAHVADIIESEPKRLETGTRFGHYEIIGRIGIGGMGEVYLARDKKLDRSVAVKILNEKYSHDESNLKRFMREAKAASALNHPNILVIHEIGESEDSHYIVSEFIEGTTLREIISQSQMSLSEILDISIQIASALMASHEVHLIHRDIKPENVMIRPDGYVKVLDFGLAKLVGFQMSDFGFQNKENKTQNNSQSELHNPQLTGQGVIMGTVNYMSPEQAKAERVDERTDIFSLGILIYEMITGRTPFAGDSASETFANLINKEPQPLSRFVANVPDELHRIITKTLCKNKDLRYQTMTELHTDLKRLKEIFSPDERLERYAAPVVEISTDSFQGTTGEARKTTAKTQYSFSKRIGQHKLLAAFLIAVLLIGTIALIYYFPRRNNAAPVFQTKKVTRLTTNKNSLYPAISPDGKYVAYVLREAPDRLSIQLMNLETHSTQQIFTPAEYRDIGSLSFSRDGNYIYFAQSETYGIGSVYGLYRMSVQDSIPTKLITDISSYSISPDGAKLALVKNIQGESALMISGADGKGEYKLASRKLSDPYYKLNWSPDGKKIVASVGNLEVSGKRMYPIEVNTADGHERLITDFKWTWLGSVIWLSDESGLIAIGRADSVISNPLWHISYPDGEVQRLTDDSHVYSIISLTADTKTLVFQTVELQTNIWTASIGDEAEIPATLAQQITTGNDGYQVSYMPDDRLLFTSPSNRLQYDIWVMNVDGKGRKQLTENAGTNVVPIASNDGRYIVFESSRAGKINIWRMDADGSNPKQLTFGDNEKGPYISPDSKYVTYTSGDDLISWIVSIEGGEPRQLIDSDWRGSIISPDGKWILAYHKTSNSLAKKGIGIVLFGSNKPIRMFDIPSDIQWHGHYQWMPDSQAFFYVGSRNGTYNIWKQPIDERKPIQMTDFKSTEAIYSPNFSPDGKQLVFSRGIWNFDIFLMKDFR